MRKYRLILKTLLILFLVDLVFVIAYWNASTRFAQDIDESYDCAIVFFHGITKTGELSDESKKRCNKAFHLFSDSVIKNIICSGGLKINNTKTGSLLMKEYLLNLHVDSAKILTDSASHSSLSNWRESLNIIKEKGYKKILVVSSPSHMLRLKYICKEPDLYVQFVTYNPDSDIVEIFSDCNFEFAKWIFLLFLPEKFADYVKDLIR